MTEQCAVQERKFRWCTGSFVFVEMGESTIRANGEWVLLEQRMHDGAITIFEASDRATVSATVELAPIAE